MISILIPTMNRADFVIRAMNYYSGVGFKGCVCIGDSSNDQHAARIQAAIESLKGKLSVIYHYFSSPPYIGNALVLRELVELAPTPYAVYSGDDDLVIPRTLNRCAEFLDGHPDYSAAHGTSVAVYLKTSGAHGQVTAVKYMLGHAIDSDSAAERWKGYIRHALSTQYYVHRTETWRRMYEYTPDVPSRYLGDEILPCSFSTLLGKIKELDGLSCVFQVNDVKSFGWATHSMYSLVMHSDWSRSAQKLREVIVKEIAQRDHRADSDAQRIFDKEFWRHLLIMMQAHYDERYEPMNHFSAFKKRFPRLVEATRLLRQVKTGRYHRVSLELLLNLGHPLHADFMPVYRAITL